MAESRKVRKRISPASSRRTPTRRPRVKSRVTPPAPFTPQEQHSICAAEVVPEKLEPVLVVGSPFGGPEVVVFNPSVAAPTLTTPTRPLAVGGFVAVMVATIIGGMYLGYVLKGRVALTHTATESRRDLGLAESPPPRRGDAWNPDAPRSPVDHAAQTASREPAPKVSTPMVAEEDRPWPHLTALMGEGIRLHRDGWYGPAMARFREAVSVMPDYLRAYLWLGRSGLKAGRYDEARRALQQVIALDPQSAAAQEAKALLSQIDKDN